MAKRKAGLHKKVSSIFDDVPVPKEADTETSEPADAGRVVMEGRKPPQPQDFVAPKPQPAPTKPAPTPAAARKIKRKPSARTGRLPHKRRKVVLFLIPVLFIVLIFVLARGAGVLKFILGEKESAKASSQEPADQTLDAENSHVEINWQIPPPYRSALRDLMRPAWTNADYTAHETDAERTDVEQSLIEEGIVIQTIVFGEEGRSVLINGRILYEGDTILGATVIKISKDKVEFEASGKRFSKSVRY